MLDKAHSSHRVDYENLFKLNKGLKKIIIYGAKFYKEKSNITINKFELKQLLMKPISGLNDFALNTMAFTESQNHNLFFNRKVYIDNRDNISHYFNDRIYGNLNTDEIENIIRSDEFQELWDITKDEIAECKNCEFRYVCPDNRMLVKSSYGEYDHLTKCNYDPEKAEWKGV